MLGFQGCQILCRPFEIELGISIGSAIYFLKDDLKIISTDHLDTVRGLSKIGNF